MNELPGGRDAWISGWISETERLSRVATRIEEARRNKVIELDLSGQGLTQWPEALEQLTQLQVLDLSGNRLTAVPEAFRHLESLQGLYLHDNTALDLPVEVLG